MQFLDLCKTEWYQMRSKRLLQPLLLLVFTTVLFGIVPLTSSDKGHSINLIYSSYAVHTNTLTNCMMLLLGAIIFLGGNARSKHLHRLRLDGLSKSDWLAAVNVQAFITALIYLVTYLAFSGACFSLSYFGLKVFNGAEAIGYFIANGLRFLVSIYAFSLLALIIGFIVNIRFVPVVFIALWFLELKIASIFHLSDDKSDVLKLPFSSMLATTNDLLIGPIMVQIIMLGVLNLMLYLIADNLPRYTSK